jgi:hypothetical protein
LALRLPPWTCLSRSSTWHCSGVIRTRICLLPTMGQLGLRVKGRKWPKTQRAHGDSRGPAAHTLPVRRSEESEKVIGRKAQVAGHVAVGAWWESHLGPARTFSERPHEEQPGRGTEQWVWTAEQAALCTESGSTTCGQKNLETYLAFLGLSFSSGLWG